MQDTTRIQELRRRVQQNPASLAFAPLAEELRRAGRFDEAIRTCRAGLQHHPEYVSARATLGRALVDRGEYDAAAEELGAVLRRAPDNLAALRGMADALLGRGDRDGALEQFRRALVFAPDDLELMSAVASLQTAEKPTPHPARPPNEARPDEARPKGENPGSAVLVRLEALLDAVLADRHRRAAGFRP